MHGGGAFLLTLSVIAGVLLLTVPAQATENNNANVVNAATEVISGITYETIYLTDDDAANMAKINAHIKGDTGNYRYVMTADWVREDRDFLYFYGSAIIFDFNGYTFDRTAGNSVMTFHARTVEVTDSSAAATGRILSPVDDAVIYATNHQTVTYSEANTCQTFTVSGGSCNTKVVMHFYKGNISFQGGNYAATGQQNYGMVYRSTPATQNITVAPGVEAAYHTGGTGYGAVDAVYTRPHTDGLTYQTVLLTGDHAVNLDKIGAHTTGNYRYVMTADWAYPSTQTGNIHIYGNAVIFDLNGYTLTIRPDDTTPQGGTLNFHSPTAEVTDSSPHGTGTVIAGITAYLPIFATSGGQCKKLTISGGNCANASLHIYNGDVIFTGGNYASRNYRSVVLLLGTGQKLTWAPYMYVETDSSKISIYDPLGIAAVRCYDEYTVSESALVSGVYNYEFANASAIDARAVVQFVPTDDKVYYLWGRKAGGWYAYLNVIYRDGAWIKVDDAAAA